MKYFIDARKVLRRILPYHSKKCHYMTPKVAYGSIAYIASECSCLGARRK
jgi:hypothetical protein